MPTILDTLNVQMCTISYGKEASFAGKLANVTITVTPMAAGIGPIRLNWAATGDIFSPFSDTTSGDTGAPGIIALPRTDQDGFRHGTTPFKNWYYKAAVVATLADGQQLARSYQFQTTSPTLDLDLLDEDSVVTALPVIVGPGTEPAGLSDATRTALAATYSPLDSPVFTGTPKIGSVFIAPRTNVRPVGQGELVINIRDWAGVTAGSDISTQLTAAITQAGPTRAKILIPTADYGISEIAIANAITIEGAGSGFPTGAPRTRLLVDSTSANGLVISSQAVRFRDIGIHNVSATTPTAGAGLLVTNGLGFKAKGVSVVGFYDNIDIDKQQYMLLDDLFVSDPVRWGLRLRNTTNPDVGDSEIRSSKFVSGYAYPTRVPAAAIRWESGGGLRILGGKINYQGNARWQRGLDFALADAAQTTDLLINGMSIENCTDRHISIVNAGTGQLGNIEIVGNQIALDGASTHTATAVYLDGSASNQGAAALHGIIVSGNEIRAVATAVYAARVSGLTVAPNQLEDVATAVQLGTNNRRVEIARQGDMNAASSRAVLYSSAVIPAASRNLSHGAQEILDSIGIPSSATSTTNWVALFSAKVGDTSSLARIRIQAEGRVEGVGPFAFDQTRIVTSPSSAGFLTATTVGTDSASGAPVDVEFQLGLAFNQVFVRVKLPTGSAGTNLWGTVRITVTGQMTEVAREIAS